MSIRLRWSDVKSELAAVLGMASTSSRVISLTNEAQQRLISKGKWVGTYARYRICINSACITWPRQIEAIEAFTICDVPGTVRSPWFEFLSNGPGKLDEDSNFGYQLVDRGHAATFDDVVATGANKLRVHSDVAESASSRILIQGYDENANWVRTLDAGEYVDGEYVTISSTYQYTSTRWSNITGIQKPVTNGTVRVYEYSTTLSSAIKAIGFYENDETVPMYRRSIIPGLANTEGCNCDSDCTNKTITVMAKLAYIPVRNDNDYLMIGNLPALKDMVKSCDYRDKNQFELAAAYEQSAVAELKAELEAHIGHGTVTPIRVEHRSTFGGGGVPSVFANNLYW